MKSAKNIVAFPTKRAERRKDELAFLPAALEIVETPPSPVGRAVAFTIIAVFAVALAWACIGTVDIVAVAPGKIIPSGRTKIIQPFETGVVRAIHVRDGQSVKAGDVLIELDPTMTGAELGHFKSDLIAAQLDVARLRAALAAKDDPARGAQAAAGCAADLVEMHRRFLVSQTAEQNAKLAAIDGQVAQKEAERATIRASIEKLKAIIPPLEERVEIRKHMFNKELGSKLVYLTELQDLLGQQQEILVQESRLSETESAIAALAETRLKTVAEYERGLFDDLSKAEQKLAGLGQDIIKAEQRTSLQNLTAPVEGVVQQLAMHTIGGVVTPAQALMVIVPAESRLEIEAMISNRDIGFVEVGQDAAIKVDAFNFTRYGLLHGKVLVRLAGRHLARQAAGQTDRQAAGRRSKQQRAEGPGSVLRRARVARPHPDAGRRQVGQSLARDGRHRRDQDRLAQHHQLPALAARALQAGEPAREMIAAA